MKQQTTFFVLIGNPFNGGWTLYSKPGVEGVQGWEDPDEIERIIAEIREKHYPNDRSVDVSYIAISPLDHDEDGLYSGLACQFCGNREAATLHHVDSDESHYEKYCAKCCKVGIALYIP